MTEHEQDNSPSVARVVAPEVKEARPEAPKKTKRPKVTAEELEARFAQKRAERAVQKNERAPRSMAKLVKVVTASVLGVSILSFGMGMSSIEKEQAIATVTHKNKAAALEGSLVALKESDRATEAVDLSETLTKARARSDALAGAQQEYASIFFAINSAPAAVNGVPGEQVLKTVEHRRVIAEFFAPESFVMDDSVAYVFRTENLLKPGEIDPRQQWFIKYGAAGENGIQQAAPAESYQWKTASVELTGTPGDTYVTWTNTDTSTGNLLAWASARYSVKTNTFGSLSVNTTTQGDSQRLKVATPTTGTPTEAKA